MADITLPFDDDLLWTPADDELHEPGPTADWVETIWFSFHETERSLAGWLYTQVRPNLGIVTGGAFVYDPRADVPWHLPYYAYQYHQPLPDPLDLRDVTFRTGVSVRCLDPGMRYALGYRFRDETDLIADLTFEGITPPIPHVTGAPPFVGGSTHYDQHGRVTGSIDLRGETIPIDCISVRDRSWGRRPEYLGRTQLLSYCFGASSPDEAFLAFCVPPADDPLAETEQLTSGYLLRDGVVCRLDEATRHNRRDQGTGAVTHIELDAVDTDGRTLRVAAEPRSRMMLNHNSLTVNTLLRWTGEVGGDGVGWGEDQDVVPMAWARDRFAGS